MKMWAAVVRPVGPSMVPAAIAMRSAPWACQNRVEPHSPQKPRLAMSLASYHLRPRVLGHLEIFGANVSRGHIVPGLLSALSAMAGHHLLHRTRHPIANSTAQAGARLLGSIAAHFTLPLLVAVPIVLPATGRAGHQSRARSDADALPAHARTVSRFSPIGEHGTSIDHPQRVNPGFVSGCIGFRPANPLASCGPTSSRLFRCRLSLWIGTVPTACRSATISDICVPARSPDLDVRIAVRPLIVCLCRRKRPASLCVEAWRCR